MLDGYEALRKGSAWLDLSARGKIFASGRDRTRLLHNLTTNHIKQLAPGQGCLAFLLSPQGRIQADVHVFCLEDRFLLDTEPELREKVIQHIRKYIIADDVKLDDATERLAAIGVEGPAASAMLADLGLAVPGDEYSTLSWEEQIIARVSATGQPALRIYLPAEKKPDLIRRLEAAGAKAASAEAAQTVRVENGKPLYGVDILDTNLPQETMQMHAIHFEKGCYLGQEIVERIRARGHVNKTLARLEINSATAPTEGTKLVVNGAEVGEITSAVFSPFVGKVLALGYVRTPHNQPGILLSAGEETARVLQ